MYSSLLPLRGSGCDAPAGEKSGRFDGVDRYTTAESERLVRLPMYYGLTKEDREKVVDVIRRYYLV